MLYTHCLKIFHFYSTKIRKMFLNVDNKLTQTQGVQNITKELINIDI